MIHFLILAPLITGLTYLLGWGTTRLLLPERLRHWTVAFSPWIGIVQTSMLLTPFGVLGIGIEAVYWVPLSVGALVFAIAWSRVGICDRSTVRQAISAVGSVLVVVILLLGPAIRRADGLNTFSLGNRDPFTYVLASGWIKAQGIFLEPPGVDWHATAYYNLFLSLDYNPRWASVLYLSFLSSVFELDPVRLFSLLLFLAFALQFPLVWVLGREILGLAGWGLTLGFLLAVLNPNPIYTAFHGFLPQAVGTGFFIGFLLVLPFYLEAKRFEWREGLLLLLFGTGILTSYLELVPFAVLIFAAYTVWTGTRQGAWPQRLGRFVVVVGVVAVVNSFQTIRMFRYLLWHVMAVSPEGDFRGGWPMPGSYATLGGLLHFQTPALWLMLVLALGTLAVWGIAADQPRRAFVLLIAVPFVVAGVVAFQADYSFAFFKDVTYVYYWLPLVIGQGVAAAAPWDRSRTIRSGRVRLLGRVLVLAVVIAVGKEAVTTNDLREAFASRAFGVPLELAGLDAANRDPRINDIFITGLDPWESHWAIYYLRDKRIGMTGKDIYVNNKRGFSDDGEWRFLLYREAFQPLIGLGERRVLTTVFRGGPFALGELAPTGVTGLGSLMLGKGFHGVERDGRQEWVWVEREAEMLIEWPGRLRAASLVIELAGVQEESLHVSLNGNPVATIQVEAGVRGRHEIPLPLVVGRNHIGLASGRRRFASWEDDPRSMNLAVFSLGLKAAR